MADYIVKEESLTAIAQAIRDKTVNQAKISFPEGFESGIRSMAGKLSRVEKIACGTFTVVSDETVGESVAHWMGVAPDVVFVIAKGELTEDVGVFFQVVSNITVADMNPVCFVEYASDHNFEIANISDDCPLRENGFTFNPYPALYPAIVGMEYFWVAIKYSAGW